jgi:hypothetical protein
VCHALLGQQAVVISSRTARARGRKLGISAITRGFEKNGYGRRAVTMAGAHAAPATARMEENPCRSSIASTFDDVCSSPPRDSDLSGDRDGAGLPVVLIMFAAPFAAASDAPPPSAWKTKGEMIVGGVGGEDRARRDLVRWDTRAGAAKRKAATSEAQTWTTRMWRRRATTGPERESRK